MRSIRVRLTLVIVLSSLVAVGLVGVGARWITSSQFDRLRVAQARASFIDTVTAYYAAHGSFDGVETQLVDDVQHYLTRVDPGDAGPVGAGVLEAGPPEAAGAEGTGAAGTSPAAAGGASVVAAGVPQPGDANAAADAAEPRDTPPHWVVDRYMRRSPFALVDAAGVAVVGAGPLRPGETAAATLVAAGTPVTLDGQRIGTVLYFAPPELRSLERSYLQRTGVALLLATVGAGALALLVGIVSTRMLTRPVHDLTDAIRGMRNGALEQRVPIRSRDEFGEMASAFNDMSAQLAQSQRLREQMTADIAHELRTPLSVVTGYLEAMSDGVLEPTPETIATLHGEARHLQDLVEDLRTLSLADAGRLTLQREPVDAGELLRSVRQAFAPLADAAGVELGVARTAAPSIDVDPKRMRQVLGNLVANALRFTPRGGHVDLCATSEGERVVLSVADSGQGMTPEAMTHIFERFYRADPARQPAPGASGLGLAIARSLVEAHGGTIRAESRVGVGTTMFITLPSAGAA